MSTSDSYRKNLQTILLIFREDAITRENMLKLLELNDTQMESLAKSVVKATTAGRISGHMSDEISLSSVLTRNPIFTDGKYDPEKNR